MHIFEKKNILYNCALGDTSLHNYNKAGGIDIFSSLLGITFGFLRDERWRGWWQWEKEGVRELNEVLLICALITTSTSLSHA